LQYDRRRHTSDDDLVFTHISARVPGTEHHFLINPYGLLTVAKNIPDAFLFMYVFESACAIQVRAQAGGDELIPVDERIIAGAKAQVKAVTRGAGGALAWPGLLRKLDRIDPGYRA
jgi:ribulose-5-phosphate 4-epimerase/fuculose-1-phosphate aldolase